MARAIALAFIIVKSLFDSVAFAQSSENWQTINTKGIELFRQGKFSEAAVVFEEAKVKAAAEYGPATPNYTKSVANLARTYETMGDYFKAKPLYEETLELIAKGFGKEHPDYATALNNLAVLYQALGLYSDAEALFVEAKEIRARTLGKESALYAASLNNLARLHRAMGDYPSAEALYLETIDIIAKVQGKENPEYATLLNNLAVLYESTGNYTKAETLCLEAMTIRARVVGKRHPDYANSLNNVAGLYQTTSNYAKAEPYYLEAVEICSNVFGKEHPVYATALGNLALLYREMGKYKEAETLHLEALEIVGRVRGKEHPDYATSLSNLSVLYHSMGNYSKAEVLCLETIEIRAKVLGKSHPDYPRALNNLALIYQYMNNYLKAEPLYLEAITLKQAEIISNFPSLSENEKGAFYSANAFYFSNFESFAVQQHLSNAALPGNWYDLKLATKGLLLNASDKVRSHIMSSNNQSLIDAYLFWKSKKNFLIKAYQMSASERQLKGISITTLEEEANALEKKLGLQSEAFATIADKKAYSWVNVRNKLKSGEAAIEMVRTNRIGDPVYAALIVTSKTANHPDVVILDNGLELEGKFSKQYRNSIREMLDDEYSYDQYWKPIAERLKGIRKVYFSPDGVYNQINLSTLRNPATNKYLVDEMDIQLVTSTKDLVTKANSVPAKVRDAYLFGFPDYNNTSTGRESNTTVSYEYKPKPSAIRGDTSQRFFDGTRIDELPGTKTEVEGIGELLKKKGVTSHEYLSATATEGEIKALKNPQVLHIATHGFFQANLPDPGGKEIAFAGIETKKLVENPLLRSGLLFAGATNSFTQNLPASAVEDGILTAYEAMNLNLDRTDLVVMSACETGLGVSANGEGVYGLQRAFQVAGAKSVLMSLWNVNDNSTQELMTMFYENWLKGTTPREAFKTAQLALRKKYPQPFHWGAFVLVGD